MIFSVRSQIENDIFTRSIYKSYYFFSKLEYLSMSAICRFDLGVFKVVSERVHYLLDNFDNDIGNTIKEELSSAYIRAISSICAFDCDKPGRDRGVDFKITPLKRLENTLIKTPEIKVQMKSTTRDILKSDGYLHYPLEIKYYNRFCTADEYPPYILAVYLVNPNREDWLCHNKEWLKISKTAYWYSFKGLKEITNKKEDDKKTILIPSKNIFSPDTLESMMMLIANGGELVNGTI